MEEEIDILNLLNIIRKRWWIMLIAAATAVTVSAVYSFLIATPIYQSNTTIYVGKNVDTQNAMVYNDVLLSDRLVNDYRELVKSRMVSDIVTKELGLENMTAKELSDKLGVNSKKDTRLIEISATDTDPEMAMIITDKVAEVFREKVVEIIKAENVQIIDKAEQSVDPVKPDKKMNMSIGLLIGLIIGAVIIFLIEHLDNTVKTPEDVQKYTGLSVIGAIPEFPEQG